MKNNRHFNGGTPLKRIYNRVYDEIKALEGEIQTSKDRLECLKEVLNGLKSQITLDEKGKAVSIARAENPVRVRAVDFNQYLKPEFQGKVLLPIVLEQIAKFGPEGCLSISHLARALALPERKAVEAIYRSLRPLVYASNKILRVGNKLFVELSNCKLM